MSTILILLLIVVNCFLGTCLFFTFRALIKKDRTDTLHQQWILDIREDINYVFKKMKYLDDKQIFRRDDEVGVVFTEMVDLITKLNERVVDEVDITK